MWPAFEYSDLQFKLLALYTRGKDNEKLICDSQGRGINYYSQ